MENGLALILNGRHTQNVGPDKGERHLSRPVKARWKPAKKPLRWRSARGVSVFDGLRQIRPNPWQYLHPPQIIDPKDYRGRCGSPSGSEWSWTLSCCPSELRKSPIVVEVAAFERRMEKEEVAACSRGSSPVGWPKPS